MYAGIKENIKNAVKNRDLNERFEELDSVVENNKTTTL